MNVQNSTVMISIGRRAIIGSKKPTCGITLISHFYEKDDFYFADGTAADLKTADQMVADFYGEEEATRLRWIWEDR